MPASTVLVTGCRGAIGRVAAAALRERGHRVVGFDRGEPAHPDDLRGDLTDAAAIRRAAEGADAIVHLAATPDEADFPTSLVPNNVVGLYHVLEAARVERVRRVVLASTLRAVYGTWDHRRFLPSDTPPSPHDFYSWTKAGAELMGAMYAREHGIAVIAARIGTFTRDRREWAMVESWRDRRSYLSWRDARTFFVRAIEAEGLAGYAALFAVSRGGGTLYDLEAARSTIGYEPVDDWPHGTPEVSGS